MVEKRPQAPILSKLDILKKIDIKNINFRRVLIGFMVVVIIGLGYTGYKINEINTRAFQVYLGEESLGIVRNEEEALSIMKDLKESLSNTYNVEVVLDKDLSFEPIHSKDDNLISTNGLKSSIKSRINFLVTAHTLTINGEEVGSLKSAEEIQFILDSIKEPYINEDDENSTIKEVKILEDVQIVKTDMPLNKVSDPQEIVEYLLTGGEKTKTHTVEVGESFWTIARIHGTTVDELIEANPDMDSSKLKPGDEVKLLLPTSKLTVATIEEVDYTENTNYETIVETDSSMFTNQKKVKVEGKRGTSKIVANEVKHNGRVVEKQIISEEVIEAPVNELIVKGTKELPKTAATGILLMPTRGRISSRYGMRNGRMHRGLDIAAKTGTAIYAADGGKVVFAGYKGTYGYMIEIDHGNGYKTRYAHCSKLLVGVGTKVYKGQHIANMGSTGRSTGSHLHLEVLKNGVHQNPSNYVK